MPEYEYEAADGSRIREWASIHEAPPLGKAIKRKGVIYRRVMSAPSLKVSINPNFVSETLPLNWPYADKHDSEGRCVFTSRADVDKATARAKGTRDEVKYRR